MPKVTQPESACAGIPPQTAWSQHPCSCPLCNAISYKSPHHSSSLGCPIQKPQHCSPTHSLLYSHFQSLSFLVCLLHIIQIFSLLIASTAPIIILHLEWYHSLPLACLSASCNPFSTPWLERCLKTQTRSYHSPAQNPSIRIGNNSKHLIECTTCLALCQVC